jgi:hypothetical protein
LAGVTESEAPHSGFVFRFLTFTHLILVGLDRRQLSDRAAVRAPARHVITRAWIEVVVMTGIALSAYIARRLSLRHKRRKSYYPTSDPASDQAT